MGDDEYHPISRKGTNLTEAGGIGYTVVDSIDTMLIMGLHDEATRARDWIANKMTFERDAEFNTFEVSNKYDVTATVIGSRLTDNHPSFGRPSIGIRPLEGRNVH